MLTLIRSLSLIHLFFFLFIGNTNKYSIVDFKSLYIIEIITILTSFLNTDYFIFKLFTYVAYTILIGIIYGTIHDISFGWISPQYWRYKHRPYSPFLINASNNDNNPRTFQHAFIWGILATWKVSLILGFLLSSISLFKTNIVPLYDYVYHVFYGSFIIYIICAVNFFRLKQIVSPKNVLRVLNGQSYYLFYIMILSLMIYFITY